MHSIIQYAKPSELAGQLKLGLYITILLFAMPVLGLLWLGKASVAIIALALPAVVLVITHPRIALYFFLLSISFYAPAHLPWITIHPFDLAGLFLIAAVGIDFLIRRKTKVISSGLDLPFLLLIAATIVSAIFAHNWRLSIVPILRLVILFFVFRAVFVMAFDIGVKKIVFFFIAHVFVLSAMNLVMFIDNNEGERIFGTAWLAFETYSMLTVPMVLVFMLLAKSSRQKWLWIGVAITIMIAIFATSSRGPLLTVVLSIPAVLFVVSQIQKYSLGTNRKHLSGSFILIALALSTVIVLFTITGLSVYVDRLNELFASIAAPQGSIALRIVLWDAAIEGFKSSPLTGIGIGNFKIIGDLFSSARLDLLWSRIDTMSAHNVFLHYLCETGMIGAFALLFLSWQGIRGAYISVTKSNNIDQAKTAGVMLLAMIIFGMTLFYMRAWTWGQEGYIMAVLFGLTGAIMTKARQQDSRIS